MVLLAGVLANGIMVKAERGEGTRWGFVDGF